MIGPTRRWGALTRNPPLHSPPHGAAMGKKGSLLHQSLGHYAVSRSCPSSRLLHRGAQRVGTPVVLAMWRLYALLLAALWCCYLPPAC